ncbi:MAG: DUF484 family protein [Betaproteobacteria bacterium]|nr:DUF484 family protein [Betaproteobacteria bacterium]
MKADQVAQYLRDHPEFFEDFADLLAEIYVPHPHGGRAIPISERQIVTLREKNKLLEGKLRELIRFGEENDAIGEKMHRFAVALSHAAGLESLIHLVGFQLKEDFAVPHVVLRVWDGGAAGGGLAEFTPVSEGVKGLAAGLAQPYCGGHAAEEVVKWFGEDGEHLRSFALVPLRQDRLLGLLALASEDAQRFYPEMGTLYLKRLGDLVSAALGRHL